MNKQQLASRIWESANNIRSKIEANEYKDYILGFIFYKFLSDKQENYLKKEGWDEEYMKKSLVETDKETVEYCQNKNGYFIEYKNLFSTWLKMGNDFDVILNRKEDEKINHLNHFYNGWYSKDGKLSFYSDDLSLYDKRKIKGTCENKDAIIEFNDNTFDIKDDNDNILLSGSYRFKDYDIILEPSVEYPYFPKEIILVSRKDN